MYFTPSLIILIIGIILSYILLGNKGEKYVIVGILFSVVIHFLPFNLYYYFKCSSHFEYGIFFCQKDSSVYKTLLIDALLKMVMGIVLLFI